MLTVYIDDLSQTNQNTIVDFNGIELALELMDNAIQTGRYIMSNNIGTTTLTENPNAHTGRAVGIKTSQGFQGFLNIKNNHYSTIKILNIVENSSLKLSINEAESVELSPGDLLSIQNSKITFAKLSINDDAKEKIWDFIQEVDQDNSIVILDITNCTQDGSLIFLQNCKAVSKNICFIKDASYSNNELVNLQKMSPLAKIFFKETHKLENFQSQTYSINWKKILSKLSTLEGDTLENSIKEFDEKIKNYQENYQLPYLNLNKDHSFYKANGTKIELRKDILPEIAEYLLGKGVVPYIKEEALPCGLTQVSVSDEYLLLGDNAPLPEDLS